MKPPPAHGGRPAASPCGSCPYRRDAPSGLWAAEEYEKLPAYDATETWEQPAAAFMCHQQDGRLCAGWVAAHDMEESFGLRMAGMTGLISLEAYDAALVYTTSTPVFGSGAEAAAHGLRGIEEPDERAVRAAGKLEKKRRAE